MNNNSPKFKALLMKGMAARKKSASIVTQQKQIKTLLEFFFSRIFFISLRPLLHSVQ